AYEYLGREDLVHILDQPTIENIGEEEVKPALSDIRVVANKTTAVKTPAKALSTAAKAAQQGMVNAAAKSMQSDAPSCNTCGHITIRSGTCYKCLNCGNSMGCS